MDESQKVICSSATVGDCTMYYEQVGSGNDIVLIHGLGGPLMWQRIIEPLGRSFRVTVVHLPGFGESPCPRQKLTARGYAALLSKLLVSLGIERAVVAGISYGGQVAAEMAIQFPRQVGRLILLCSTGLSLRGVAGWPVAGALYRLVGEHIVLKSRWPMEYSSRMSFHDLASRPHDLVEKYFEQISREGSRGVWANCVRDIYGNDEEFRQRLASIQAPTLVFWGENDRLIPVRYADEFAGLIPDASTIVFKECGHSIPLEKAEEMCGAIGEFMVEFPS